MVGDATSPQKKRKLGQKESIQIHCLPDELLLEILCRLSCSKFVIQCKSVCKHWASLISSPLFLGWFIADKGKLQVFSTLVRVHRSREIKDTWKGMMIYLKDPIFNIDNLFSSSLPSFKDGNATALTVHASCKDLLLYCRDELGKQDYYICNVQTQQWLPLPALPFYHRSICVAFTCDPYYFYGERKDNISRDNIILNPTCRYSVVIVPYQEGYRTTMNAHLFSSNRNGNEWREIVLSLPKPCGSVALTTGFVYDGMLHFVMSV